MSGEKKSRYARPSDKGGGGQKKRTFSSPLRLGVKGKAQKKEANGGGSGLGKGKKENRLSGREGD